MQNKLKANATGPIEYSAKLEKNGVHDDAKMLIYVFYEHKLISIPDIQF